MSRHSSQTSYGHRIVRVGGGCYQLSWTVDRYYANSRLRFPTGFSRQTDLAGAKRFAARWDILLPTPFQPPSLARDSAEAETP